MCRPVRQPGVSPRLCLAPKGAGIHLKAWGSAPCFVKEALPALKARFTSGTGSTLRAWLKRTFGACLSGDSMPGAMSQAGADIAPSALTTLYGKRWINVPSFVQARLERYVPSSKSRTFRGTVLMPSRLSLVGLRSKASFNRILPQRNARMFSASAPTRLGSVCGFPSLKTSGILLLQLCVVNCFAPGCYDARCPRLRATTSGSLTISRVGTPYQMRRFQIILFTANYL